MSEHTCQTSVCPLCNGVSWSGKGVAESSEVGDVMSKYPRKDWCKCLHVVDADQSEYPPKAGTGQKKST